MLPNFFVVGAQKCATTSLYYYLREHPEIYLPMDKETKFFVRDDEYIKGIKYYESEYFSDYNGEKAIGEIDPDYMYFENTLERISKHIDLRNLINVKKEPKYPLQPYIQVLEENHGFLPNLSVLDLLFNEGTNALNYLESQEIFDDIL